MVSKKSENSSFSLKAKQTPEKAFGNVLISKLDFLGYKNIDLKK